MNTLIEFVLPALILALIAAGAARAVATWGPMGALRRGLALVTLATGFHDRDRRLAAYAVLLGRDWPPPKPNYARIARLEHEHDALPHLCERTMAACTACKPTQRRATHDGLAGAATEQRRLRAALDREQASRERERKEAARRRLAMGPHPYERDVIAEVMTFGSVLPVREFSVCGKCGEGANHAVHADPALSGRGYTATLNEWAAGPWHVTPRPGFRPGGPVREHTPMTLSEWVAGQRVERRPRFPRLP